SSPTSCPRTPCRWSTSRSTIASRIVTRSTSRRATARASPGWVTKYATCRAAQPRSCTRTPWRYRHGVRVQERGWAARQVAYFVTHPGDARAVARLDVDRVTILDAIVDREVDHRHGVRGHDVGDEQRHRVAERLAAERVDHERRDRERSGARTDEAQRRVERDRVQQRAVEHDRVAER